MGAISFGPLVLAGDRLAAVTGLAGFMLASFILSSRFSRRFDRWSVLVLLFGLVAARLGHVVEHLDTFSMAPLRALAVWQGGFSWPWAAGAATMLTLGLLRSASERILAALALGSGLLVWAIVGQLVAAGAGQPLPEFALKSLDGPEVRLEPDGRPTVLNLWASWCPPCRREMPTLARAARTESDARFVFVDQGEADAVVRSFLSANQLSGIQVLLDPTSSVTARFRAPGLPVTLFFGRDGHLRDAHAGEISQEVLAEKLARAEAGS
ncbi:TlpA disulfide reductase family protein [Alsobacter soli]|nr:TlpA disulfide reductase family protein [Alsobacter soli]